MKNPINIQPVFYICPKFFSVVFLAAFFAIQTYAYPGRLDFSFQQILAAGANVTAIDIQTDGKILVAGKFSTRGSVLRQDVMRLNPDGSLDLTFDLGGATDFVSLIRFIKLQNDGKIIIAGYINRIGKTYVRSVVRLNPNGNIDTTFNLTGIDVVYVSDLDIQTDAKILISASNLIGLSFVTRLKTDGSNDQGVGQPLFTGENGGINYRVTFVPTENKIMIGGDFTYSVNQIKYKNLARLNLNGAVDSTFSADVTNSTFDLLVNTKILNNGKILVWGKFDTVNGISRRNLAILNNDGSLDLSFNPATNGSEILITVAVQSNGKIIVGGNKFVFNTLLRGNIARLNTDGSVDSTFNQGRGTNEDVRALKIKNNNKLLVGGTFFRYHIFPRTGLVQINL